MNFLLPNGQQLINQHFQSGQKLMFAKGELVARPDDKSKVYLLEKGYVKLYGINNRGEEYVHIIYGPNEIFPLVWMLDKTEARREIFAEAVGGPASVWSLPRQRFLSMIQSEPDLTLAMLSQAVQQFNFYAYRVDNLEYKYASERLAYRLLVLASRFGVRQGSEVIVSVPLNQQDIGNSINLSRETVSREFDRLMRKGLVGYSGRKIVIKNVAKLTRELQDSVKFNL